MSRISTTEVTLRMWSITWCSRRSAVLLGLLAAAAPLTAQRVAGTVLQPDSATRAAGVIVVAADARGQVVGRALSGDDGAFNVALPGAGTYVLRLLRVGYRPTVLDSLVVPAGGVSGLRAVLSAAPVRLAAVTVRSDNVCGTTQDAGRVVAQLWEEARTALSAAVLSTGAQTLDAEWQAFQFELDGRSRRAKEYSVLSQRGANDRPFVSASAADLATAGYLLHDGLSWTYRAPDAAALISDEFAATHCFHVEPPTPARAQWVGIAFAPTPERRRARDIAGMLWLDRATSELRLLEFRYTNLPPEGDDPDVGGYVEYARMATGHWLVARWAIRMPRLTRQTVGGAAIPGGGRDDRTTLVGIDVTGGELVQVRHDGTQLFAADSTLIASERTESLVPAHPSACGAAMRAGAVLNGTVHRGTATIGGAVIAVTWASGAGGAPVTLATVADAKGTFRVPCVARGVPLSVVVTVGDARQAPLAVAPVSGRNAIVDIDVQAAPGAPLPPAASRSAAARPLEWSRR